MKKKNRGGIGTGLAVFVVLMLLAFGACLAVADDDDDEDGISRLPRNAHVANRDGGDRDRGRDSRGDCESSKQCSDDDFSPSFDESPVYLCLPNAECHFGEDESAALFPPNPQRLVEVITAFGQNVGTAAGALAGAIAGGTVGIFLAS